MLQLHDVTKDDVKRLQCGGEKCIVNLHNHKNSVLNRTIENNAKCL